MMDEVLASRIHITESDLRTFYEAHKQEFLANSEDPNAPAQIMPFDQARDQVLLRLAQQKRQEVQGAYLQEVMDRYTVVIHGSAFGEPNDR